MPPNSSKIDPTRSISLRRSFAGGITRQFQSLAKAITGLVFTEDAFGLAPLQYPLVNQAFSYGSTQFNIEDPLVLSEVKRVQSGLLGEDVVKLEDEPHITVRYGLTDYHQTVDRVRQQVSGFGPVRVKFGKLSVFETPKGDVLKFDIDSDRSEALHILLGLLPHTDTHPVYQPHMTVAYLNPGSGAKYVQSSLLTGKELTLSILLVSDVDGNKTPIDLLAPLLNKRWKYRTQEEAVDEFEKWLRDQVTKTLMSQTEATRWRRYINRGFVKGANRAFDDVDRATKKRGLDSLRAAGFQEGRREQFLRQTLGKITAVEKVKALQSRALADVKGMTEDLITKARRSLTDSLVKNLSPREASAQLRKVLKISETRADSIAFTELVRAHADGQLEAMEQLGIERVGVAVEWSTAFGACPLCSTLKGIVLTIEEAKGLIPRHVRCRCAFTLANVGEDASGRKGQVRSKTKIDRALKKSAKLGPESDTWESPVPVASDRPKSVLNVECTCHPSLIAFESLTKKDGGE